MRGRRRHAGASRERRGGCSAFGRAAAGRPSGDSGHSAFGGARRPVGLRGTAARPSGGAPHRCNRGKEARRHGEHGRTTPTGLLHALRGAVAFRLRARLRAYGLAGCDARQPPLHRPGRVLRRRGDALPHPLPHRRGDPLPHEIHLHPAPRWRSLCASPSRRKPPFCW